QCRIGGLRFNLMDTSFIIGRERVRPRPRGSAFWRWRDRLFSVMTNNMLDATEFFRIPPNRVVELGGQIEICAEGKPVAVRGRQPYILSPRSVPPATGFSGRHARGT